MNIIQAIRNSATPQASLAAWQNLPLFTRRKSLAGYYVKTATLTERRKARITPPFELSGPSAESPLLWIAENDKEVLDWYTGDGFRDLAPRWYCDEFQEETIQAVAVRLKRFPHLIFGGTFSSCGDTACIHLNDCWEIDFSDCNSEYQTQDCIEETAKDMFCQMDSVAQRQAEREREYQAEEAREQDLADKREELKANREAVLQLIPELRQLCAGTLPESFPAAARAVRSSLKSLLNTRTELFSEIETLTN